MYCYMHLLSGPVSGLILWHVSRSSSSHLACLSHFLFRVSLLDTLILIEFFLLFFLQLPRICAISDQVKGLFVISAFPFRFLKIFPRLQGEFNFVFLFLLRFFEYFFTLRVSSLWKISFLKISFHDFFLLEIEKRISRSHF